MTNKTQIEHDSHRASNLLVLKIPEKILEDLDIRENRGMSFFPGIIIGNIRAVYMFKNNNLEEFIELTQKRLKTNRLLTLRVLGKLGGVGVVDENKEVGIYRSLLQRAGLYLGDRVSFHKDNISYYFSKSE